MSYDVAAMAEVVQTALDQGRGTDYDPWFYTYCGPLREARNLDKYVRHLKYTFALAGREVKGQRVLDAGCGFGVTCLACHFLGAQEVHGVDIYGGMIRTFQSYLAELMPYSPIHATIGNVANLDFADDSFDCVLAIEAISHFYDLRRFFAEAHRVLKVGGALLISDGNNACNPLIVRRTRKVWDSFEKGITAGRGSPNSSQKPYVEMRREIIEELCPTLGPDDVQELAERTFGLTKTQVADACRQFIEKGALPNRKRERLDCPVDPIGEIYMERLFDPFQLKRQLDDIGFTTRAYAYLGGARGGLAGLLDRGLRPMSRLSIHLASAYKIVAVKRK